MGRYRYLLKNIGLLTLSSFATKILSFFLVPLYTNILTTAEYGSYDLINTTIGVLVPIFTCNILDGVLRFSIDEDKDHDAIATVSIRYCLVGCFLSLVVVLINRWLSIFQVINDFPIYFVLLFLTNSSYGIITAYSRGTDHIKQLSISSIIASAITIALNIWFLVFLKWGIEGYFIANIIGPMIQSLYLLLSTGMIGRVKLKKGYPKMNRDMFVYSLPLITNTISWWINSASDRYVVTWFCGITTNGIYAVASKIPSILNIFQTIFNQAWTLSAVKEYDPEDSTGFFRKTYSAYNCMLVILCALIISLDKLLSKVLYQKDFFQAWEYVPFLTIAIVFGALAGYLGGVLAAVKDSKSFAKSTLTGATINLALNFALTPFIGALGAAIATALSYLFVWSTRIVNLRQHIKLKVNISRDVVSYILLFLQAGVLLVIHDDIALYMVQCAFVMIVITLYIKDIRTTLVTIIEKRKNVGDLHK